MATGLISDIAVPHMVVPTRACPRCNGLGRYLQPVKNTATGKWWQPPCIQCHGLGNVPVEPAEEEDTATGHDHAFDALAYGLMPPGDANPVARANEMRQRMAETLGVPQGMLAEDPAPAPPVIVTPKPPVLVKGRKLRLPE